MARVRYWIGFAAVLSMAALFMTPTVQAQSVEESKASVEAMPDDPPRHYNLGRAFFKAGQFKESIASFEKAIELKEDYKEAYSSLGSAFLKPGNSRSRLLHLKRQSSSKKTKEITTIWDWHSRRYHQTLLPSSLSKRQSELMRVTQTHTPHWAEPIAKRRIRLQRFALIRLP